MGENFASFVVRIPPPPAGTSREGSPDGLCVWEGRPQPLTVQVSVSDAGVAVRRYAQNQLVEDGDADQLGYVRVAYGVGAARQTVDVDLVSQTFALPVCDYAAVSVRQFAKSSTAATNGTDVSVSVAPGLLTGDPVAPTSTILRYVVPVGGTTDNFVPPAKARWIQLSVISDSLVSDDLVLDVTQIGGRIDMGSGSNPFMFPAHAFWPVPAPDVSGFDIVSSRTAAGSSAYMLQYFMGL
jgi:hypothetical protein